MSNPNSKAYIPPSSNAANTGTGIYVPSFPLQFKLSDPNVTSNIVQTLSTLTSEVATTKKKLQGVEVVSSKALAVANKETNGVPQALWSLDVTQTAQMKASYTNDFISCSFTYNTKDPNFGFVRVYVTGLNGGTEPIQVASGATSPITFDMDATGQTVTITAQSYSVDINAADLTWTAGGDITDTTASYIIVGRNASFTTNWNPNPAFAA